MRGCPFPDGLLMTLLWPGSGLAAQQTCLRSVRAVSMAACMQVHSLASIRVRAGLLSPCERLWHPLGVDSLLCAQLRLWPPSYSTATQPVAQPWVEAGRLLTGSAIIYWRRQQPMSTPFSLLTMACVTFPRASPSAVLVMASTSCARSCPSLLSTPTGCARVALLLSSESRSGKETFVTAQSTSDWGSSGGAARGNMVEGPSSSSSSCLSSPTLLLCTPLSHQACTSACSLRSL